MIGEQAASFGPATLLRDLKARIPAVPWLEEGPGGVLPGRVYVVRPTTVAPTSAARAGEPAAPVRPDVALTDSPDVEPFSIAT